MSGQVRLLSPVPPGRRAVALTALALLAAPALLPTAEAKTAAAPVFRQYHAPESLRSATESGEPTISFNPQTGAYMFMANTGTYRVTGFDLRRNERATWVDVTDPVIGAQTADPILHRDPQSGRVFVNQLVLGGRSLQAFTDDDGATYQTSVLGSAPGLAFDHQSVSSGRPAPVPGPYPLPMEYPSYVYYCTSDYVAASCGASIDGGLTYLPAKTVYPTSLSPALRETTGNCGPIFGHVKSDPRDGTVYLAPEDCPGGQRLYVSQDNTFSWTHHVIPDSTRGDAGHPSLAVGRQDGAVYLAWGSGDGWSEGLDTTGRVHVAASRDKGETWTPTVALGRELGVVATRFPVAVAGDAGRAAVAFLGATADGNPGGDANGDYLAEWHLYVSFTTDGGRTWKTYDATPHDPIQVGPICSGGLLCGSARNLLDFNDMTLDESGRVVIALADGSPTGAEDYRSGLAHATIIRQVGGPSLYAGSTRR